MKNINRIALTVATTLVVMAGGCRKDETTVDPPAPDNEFITTVEIKATNQADTTDVKVGKWVQMGATAAIDSSQAKLDLKRNAVYSFTVHFKDETKTPVADINEEVTERSNYHLVCYDVPSALKLTVRRTDYDNNSPKLELGLMGTFTTTDSSAGTMTVSLHHQPDVKNGDCSRGSTDASVGFRVRVY